jgi:protein TonB
MQNWRYPPEARAYLIEGTLVILFSITKDGNMTHIAITETSGHEILDQEVIRAINKAVPFPRFPESISVKRLNINARFDYRLSSKKKNKGN